MFCKNSRLRQCLKDGVARRIETVVNDPRYLRCNRLLANLPELQAKARAINARLMDTETVGRGTALVSPVIERITRPTLIGQGRKAPALRFGDLRVQALAGSQVHAGESVHRRRAGVIALMDVGSFDDVGSEAIRTFVT